MAYENNSGSGFLQNLKGPIAMELRLSIYHPLVMRSSYFIDLPREVIKNLALSLQDAIYLPGDYVIRAGDFGREMFFILRGMIEILNENRMPLNRLYDGVCFGEIALLT